VRGFRARVGRGGPRPGCPRSGGESDGITWRGQEQPARRFDPLADVVSGVL